MHFEFNIFSQILLFLTAILAFLALYIFKNGNKTANWFGWLMVSAAVWSFNYALELSSSNFHQAYFFVHLEYLGIASLPVFWYLFCLHFSQKEHLVKNRLSYLTLIIVPIITVVVMWTNSFHHLHYQTIKMVETKYFPVLSFKTGIWYRLFVIYFYSLLIIGFYHIINKVRTAPSIYRKQNYTVLLAALMPWLTNLLYLGGIKPLHFIDLTPFAFSATSILIFYSVYRFKLFDIVPIARQKLFSLMDDGILVLDSDYHIIDSNFTVRKFLPIGRSKHNKPLDLEMIEHAFPHLLEQLQINEPTVKEYCVKNDFETTYTEISSRLFEDDETKKQIFIVRFRDITTIKAEAIETELQREKLAKLDQLKTRIFSIISHDLRGPLVNLTEVLKMLAENELSDEEFKYLTPNIKKDINYTVNLLENLLHWSRSQIAGKGEKNEFINFTTLAKGEIRRQQTAADQKGVALKLELKPSISVFADYTMLQIVLRNLISNAIKFCNMKNTVQVVAEEDEDWVIVKVIDSGVGMDGKSLERLFSNEDFSLRGTNNERGTGLGVLICKEFMHKMNGKITVTSELGIGTQFQLWLPKHKNVSARYQQTE